MNALKIVLRSGGIYIGTGYRIIDAGYILELIFKENRESPVVGRFPMMNIEIIEPVRIEVADAARSAQEPRSPSKPYPDTSPP